jgi:hypothetical protein
LPVPLSYRVTLDVPMTVVAAAEAATAPPNRAAGYRRSGTPVTLSMTTSVRAVPARFVTPTVTTPGQARTDMTAEPGLKPPSVICHSAAPLASW